MNPISSVSSTPNPYQIGAQADSTPKVAKSTTPGTPGTPTAATNGVAATGPADSDGDHDGSGINVTA